MTDRPDIEGFLALAGRATPEPWHSGNDDCYIWGPNEEMVADQDICRARGAGAGLPITDNMAFIAQARAAGPAISSYALSLESELIALKSLLTDCYRHMHDAYDEERPSRYDPPEPANRWSAEAVPLFVAIQRATGLGHGEIMDVVS